MEEQYDFDIRGCPDCNWKHPLYRRKKGLWYVKCPVCGAMTGGFEHKMYANLEWYDMIHGTNKLDKYWGTW